jgi:hypothetical protein
MAMNPTSKLTGAAAVIILWSLAALAQQPAASPPEESAEPVVGQMEHAGYGLVGSGGRHYIFGGLAVADYSRAGQQHIVTLQLEEPTTLAKPDQDFLYYRELGSGHRWAIGRHPLKDDTYAVYFQPAPTSEGAVPTKWSLFHRARLIWEESGEGHPQIPQMTQTKNLGCIDLP